MQDAWWYVNIITCWLFNDLLIKEIFNYNLKEFEEPALLLDDRNSMFYRLVHQTGEQSVIELKEMANKVV